MSTLARDIAAKSIGFYHLTDALKNVIRGANKNIYIPKVASTDTTGLLYYGDTTDATSTELFIANNPNNRYALLNNTLYDFTFKVLALNSTDSNGFVGRLTFSFRTDGAGGATYLANDMLQILNYEGSMNNITISTSVLSGELYINVTGLALKNIEWKLIGSVETV